MGIDLRALLHAGETSAAVSVPVREKILEQFLQAFQQAPEQVSVIHAVPRLCP
jgi:hypothetical protein